MKLDSVYVVVSEMDAARTFYAAVFDREPALVDDRFSGFELGGSLFGLLNRASFGEPVDDRPLAYGTNCVPNIRVSDLNALYARMQELDLPHLTAIQESGTYRLFQLEDPDGNRVEFYEASEHPGHSG